MVVADIELRLWCTINRPLEKALSAGVLVKGTARKVFAKKLRVGSWSRNGMLYVKVLFVLDFKRCIVIERDGQMFL
jgi:hypothetical protein